MNFIIKILESLNGKKIAPKWNSGKTINYGKRGELDLLCESLNFMPSSNIKRKIQKTN